MLQILAVISFASLIQELSSKANVIRADYQHLALVLLISAGTGWGLWALLSRMLQSRREYRDAVTAFRRDETMSPVTSEQHCADYLKLTDAEWRLIEPMLPGPSRVGRPRKTLMRVVVDAIFYIASTGCQWRLLPRDFPPFSTVQGYFYAWSQSGLLAVINHQLVIDDARKVCA